MAPEQRRIQQERQHTLEAEAHMAALTTIVKAIAEGKIIEQNIIRLHKSINT